VENFFLAHGFVEIQTPTLVPSPGSEPFLDPFVVELQHEGQTHKKFLPTSPELHLKKALCLGWERIFEVRPCFRNGEWGNHHRPEFIMLEWYRAYENLDRILSDCQHLFSWVARSLGLPPPDPFENLTLQEAFLKYVDPNFLLTPHTCRKDLAALASRLCIETEPSDDFDDIFFRLFLEKIEPHLSGPIPIVLRNYPPSQAALSRKTVEGWADRFEIYWQGYEIANAFHELNDPFEQCQRLEKDNKKKNSLGKPIVPIDQEFIQGLMSGMPPSGGIALGLERLFLAFHPKLEIGQLRLFEFLNDSTIDHF
jgi:lysyl-tRNA synthetase class 2